MMQTFTGDVDIQTPEASQEWCEKLRDVSTITGYLVVEEGARLDAPELVLVRGYVRIEGTANLGSLKTIGKNLYVGKTAKMCAPNLVTVYGDICIFHGAHFAPPAIQRYYFFP